MQGQTVSLPSILSGTSSRFLLALIAPIPLCATLVESLESRVSSQEETGLRNIPFLDAGLSLASAGVAVVSALGVSMILDTSSAITAGRNTAFLVGLTLLARSIIGRTATMIPVVWIFCVVFFGYKNPQQPYFWAVLPEEFNNLYAATAAFFSLSAGLAAQILWQPRSHETGEA
ncbi:hypothetical protein [Streptomyces sp. NPDC048565]|uniref:hypothetical protein n=1 Tax=Streptomyces sp. NPDC048565 TaxID=3155266 RepID=UPI003433E5C8